MVLLRDKGTEFAEFSSASGALRAWVLAPNVFVTQGEGHKVHLAVRSRIIAMGVQVANVAVGGIMRAHTGIATLEVELARVLRISGSPMASLRPPAPR